MVSEGLATDFSDATSPGPPSPWVHQFGASQECTLWKKARPLLGQTGLYEEWITAGGDEPARIGYAIGSHIVSGYLSHHPGTSWPAMTRMKADEVFAGSHYQP